MREMLRVKGIHAAPKLERNAWKERLLVRRVQRRADKTVGSNQHVTNPFCLRLNAGLQRVQKTGTTPGDNAAIGKSIAVLAKLQAHQRNSWAASYDCLDVILPGGGGEAQLGRV